MTENTVRQRDSKAVSRLPRFRVGALIALIIAVGFIIWLAVRDSGSSNSSPKSVSPADLQNLARTVGHPVFWIGEQDDNTYELTQRDNGTISVRYLPPGISVGVQGQYWTVTTYPFDGAFVALKRVTSQSGTTTIKLANGGLANYADSNPNIVHIAYPEVNYQAEVYAPAGGAVSLVNAGRVTSFGGPQGGPPPSTTAPPKAESEAGLTALAGKLGHPIYWAGRKKGDTYELTRDSTTGQVLIRYLPSGAPVGSKKNYLAIATYPFPGGYDGIKRASKTKGTVSFKFPGGGLAVFDPNHPTNVHFAYPGTDVQGEVYEPKGKAKELLTSGQIAAIG
jgi:hypothetical protein